MKVEIIKKLCCPFDRAELKLTTISKDINGDIIEGYLFCEVCKRIYPIVSGIPIMSPDEYREFKLEQPLLDRWTNGKVNSNFRLTDSDSQSKKPAPLS